MRHLIIGAGPAESSLPKLCAPTMPGRRSWWWAMSRSHRTRAWPFPTLVGQVEEPGTYLRQTAAHFDALHVALRNEDIERIDPAPRPR